MKNVITRRDCLGRLAMGTLGLGVTVSTGGCAGLRRADITDSGRGWQALEALGDERYTEILYYASLAPSSHNTQPWSVKVESPGVWLLQIPSERRLSAVDPAGREALLSMGAFLEYLQLAAASRGIEAGIELIASSGSSSDIARITLGQPSGGDPNNLQKIGTRRTLRSNYQSKEIVTGDVSALAEQWGNEFQFFAPGSAQASYVRDGAVESFRQQTNNDDAQRELMNWTRLKDADARKYRDGLTTESMEIRGIAGWFVRTFMSTEDIMGESYRKQGIDLASKQVKECGGWAVAAISDETATGVINAGRSYARLCLSIRERKIAIHPMTQILEEAPWRDEVRSQLGVNGIPQFILRIGYLDSYPDPVSIRRPPSWFVTA